MLIKKPTCVYDLSFNLVFVTKYCKPIFNTQQKCMDIKTILNTIGTKNDIQINIIKIMPNYIFMLISFKPKLAPSNVVKSFKGTSAREWFKKYPQTKQQLSQGHLWSPSFFISTVGNVSNQIIQDYINHQAHK